ncbi:MAG: LytR/AlgR family response regulator transcription factor [Flavisolibacter sp.]
MAGIKIMLVEDDWIIAKEISYSLQDFGFEVVGSYDTGEEALQQVKTIKPDIVLLDISLSGELTGIDVAQKLKELQIPFIFLTALADSQTISQAKLSEPYAYLVKPVNPESLYSTIEITLYNVSRKKGTLVTPPLKEGLTSEESIFVKTKNRLEKLLLEDILWIEASDIYTLVCTSSGKHLLNTSLKTVEEKFPSSKFIRVHRSYIVNLNRIDAIQEDDLIIADATIPIGKTYREKLMTRLSFL